MMQSFALLCNTAAVGCQLPLHLSSLTIDEAAALLRRIINNNNMQKYALGTIVSKEFAISNKLQHFKGKVKAYNEKHQLYRIIYEDGDEEEMDERDISLHFVSTPKKTANEAAEALIEMANSPPRDSRSRTTTSSPTATGDLLPPFNVDGRVKKKPSMASLFDSDSDEDDRIGALPQLSRRSILPDSDLGDVSKGDDVAGIHTDSRAKADERGGRESVAPNEKLQSSVVKKDVGNGKKKKKRKAPDLPMKRNEGKLSSSKEKGKIKEVVFEGKKEPKQPTKEDILRLQKKRKLGLNGKGERKMKAATLSGNQSQNKITGNKQDKDDSDNELKQSTGKAESSRITKKKRKLANASDQLRIGDTVYAPWWKTKTRGRSYTLYRATITRIKNKSTLLYDVTFDDGTRLNGIDESMVISKHCYLNESIKPKLRVGQRVVAGWWEDPLDTTSPPAGWFPGVIKRCRQLKQGGTLGPDRFYDVKFDDGDELDDIEDIFVYPESEYELLGREASGEVSWKGVRNVLDKDSIDRYANTVGYWVACVGENEDTPFPLLGDALRYYDDLVVSRKGARVKKKDLNLPEEWVSKGKKPPMPSVSRPSRKNDVKVADDTKTASISQDTRVEKVMEKCDSRREECVTQLDVRRMPEDTKTASISQDTRVEKVTEECDSRRKECVTQLDVRRLSIEEQSAFSESMKDLIDEAKKIIND